MALALALALALDASTSQGTSYVDIRVRFVWQRQFYSIFDVLSPNWKKQLDWRVVGRSAQHAWCKSIIWRCHACTNVWRREHAALGGFYRVWCLLHHQLDLPLQLQAAAYQKLDDGKWLATFVAMIDSPPSTAADACCRNGLGLSYDVDDDDSVSNAMCSSTSWLTNHRHEVMGHYTVRCPLAIRVMPLSQRTHRFGFCARSL